MDTGELVFVGSAAVLGAVHTALGVDHTLPILAVSKAHGFKLSKTLGLTAIVGVAHVASAALIFVVGALIGFPIDKLLQAEDLRAEVATRGLLAIGLSYGTLALIRLVMSRRKDAPSESSPAWMDRAGWIGRAGLAPLAIAFSALGPCEPLLPVLAAQKALGFQQVSTLLAFSVGTLGAMLGLVAVGFVGLGRLSQNMPSLSRFMPWAHVIAGYSIALSAFSPV